MAVLSNSDYDALTSSNVDFSQLDTDLIEDFLSCGFLVDDDRDELSEIKFLYWKNKFDSGKFCLTIMTTLDCNFRCTYCFEKHKNVEMSSKTIKKIEKMVEKELKKGYTELSVDWYGGEPLLNMQCIIFLSNFFISLCQKRGIKYTASITTNGYDFTIDTQKVLFDLGVRHAQITLDGSKSMHDKRRVLLNGESSFDVIKSNIVNAIKGMSISLRINVDEENKDDLKSIVDSLGEYRSDELGIYACIVTPALESNYIVGEYRYLMDAILQLYSYAIDRGFHVNSVNCLLINDYRTCIVDSDHHFIITPSGDLFKCGESYEADDPGKIGLLSADGNLLVDINKSARWTKDPFAYEECNICPYLPVCMGGCIMKRLNKKNNYCFWEMKDRHEGILELLYEVISRDGEMK